MRSLRQGNTHLHAHTASLTGGRTGVQTEDRAGLPEVARYAGRLRRERIRMATDQIDEAIRLYSFGWSLARVGEHLDVDPLP
jgi:hypothetical protein